jgi:adenylate kinase
VAFDILLLGPQGSGKGTQAKRIAAEYGLPHVATGDILRQAIADGTELGQRVKPIYDAGRLVPDDLMIELIRERLSRPDAEAGFVLDGFPRTADQAEALDRMLAELGRRVDVVFDLRIPDEELLIDRLVRRAREEGRSDDTPDAIHRRLELYRTQTAPLVERYRATRGNVVGIHADRGVDQVFSEIQDALEQVAVR